MNLKKIIQKISVITIVFGSLFGYNVIAKTTKYMSDELIEYGRGGDGDGFRIVAAVKAGDKLEVLATGKKYTKVRDERDRVFWVQSKRLVDEPSARNQVPVLESKINDLNLRLQNINQEWTERTNEIREKSQVTERQNYELLEKNANLKRELTILKNRNRELEIIQDSKQREIMIQWFIYGGSVLGIGLIFGLIIPFLLPRRRRDRW